MFKPRIYVKLSNDLKGTYNWCKGPGGTGFSVCRRLAEASRAQLRGQEYGARGYSTQRSEAMERGARSISHFS